METIKVKDIVGNQLMYVHDCLDIFKCLPLHHTNIFLDFTGCVVPFRVMHELEILIDRMRREINIVINTNIFK